MYEWVGGWMNGWVAGWVDWWLGRVDGFVGLVGWNVCIYFKHYY